MHDARWPLAVVYSILTSAAGAMLWVASPSIKNWSVVDSPSFVVWLAALAAAGLLFVVVFGYVITRRRATAFAVALAWSLPAIDIAFLAYEFGLHGKSLAHGPNLALALLAVHAYLAVVVMRQRARPVPR